MKRPGGLAADNLGTAIRKGRLINRHVVTRLDHEPASVATRVGVTFTVTTGAAPLLIDALWLRPDQVKSRYGVRGLHREAADKTKRRLIIGHLHHSRLFFDDFLETCTNFEWRDILEFLVTASSISPKSLSILYYLGHWINLPDSTSDLKFSRASTGDGRLIGDFDIKL